MKRLAVLALLGLASCESPEAPAACGPIADVTVNAGEATTVAACFNDPNGDVLSYSVTASDPGGLKGEQAFSVTVPNRAPVAGDPIPDMEVVVGNTVEVDASEHFTEPDGETLEGRRGSGAPRRGCRPRHSLRTTRRGPAEMQRRSNLPGRERPPRGAETRCAHWHRFIC